MFGLLKGYAVLAARFAVAGLTPLLSSLDAADNFENLTDELRGASRIGQRISEMFGVNHQRSMFRRISHSYSEQTRVEECSTAEKVPREQRVTVHCEKGQAPSLQIRFSILDFPPQAVVADVVQQRRRSLPGLIPGYAGASTSTRQHGESDISDETTDARNMMLETRRAKSEVVTTGTSHYILPDWIRPPERIHTRQGSGATISDSLSIVRDLERRFPNLPPRVTGKYRGSILGDNYDEDPFPIVGVSRQSSLRDGGAHNPSEESGHTVTLSPSGSIKRKPAPPLLQNMSYIVERRKRPASTWGGLTQNTADYPADSPRTPNGPWKSPTGYGPNPALAGEPSTPKSRRTTAMDVIRRASRALSDASIRSAEWFASASSPRLGRTPITETEIEMYRRGALGPGSARPTSGVGHVSSGHSPPKAGRRSTDDVRAHPIRDQFRNSVGI